MKYFAGLDVSLDETAICIVDEDGIVISEGKAASEPDDLVRWLAAIGLSIPAGWPKRRIDRAPRDAYEVIWIEYYGRYAPSALYPLLRYVNQRLVAWAMRKFKRFKAHKVRAGRFLQQLAVDRPDLFVHWQLGMRGVFN